MSKGLEALEELKTETVKGGTSYIGKHFKRHYHRIIEKELKALEIIKNKKVDIHTLYRDSDIIGDTFDYYNNTMLFNRGTQYELTQEEYDLLKEVLLWFSLVKGTN